MRRLLCVLALSMIAAPAFADPPGGELSAAPSVLADGLIDEANADGLFESLPAEQSIAVRHARSGLVCRLAPSNTNRLIVFPQAARGEDVACDTTDGRESITLYATRLSFQTTLDELIAGAEAAIRNRFPDAQPYGASLEVGADISAPFRTIQFLVTNADGARMYARVSIAQIGAWTIKQRYTLLAPNDESIRQGERTSSMSFAASFNEIASRQP